MHDMLRGITVVDLSRVLAGPFATMILGDLGAEVIKVERPESGDDSRGFGPHVRGESAYFASVNRNKRSITVNLRTPQGAGIVRELAASADVLVENFRPGTTKKWELDYESLKRENPRIIYLGISGFGRTGPYAQKPAYDAVIQAMGGIMSITGHGPGEYTKVGASIADLTAGLYGVIGVLAALQQRERTGVGTLVDIGMLDCQVSILENAVSRFFASGEVPQPLGNRHPSIVPFEAFATSDGQIMVAAGNDSLWGRLCTAAGRPDLGRDPRFGTNALRTANHPALQRELAACFAGRTTEEWAGILDRAGVPSGPINTVDRVVADPQILSRGTITEVEHPVMGAFKTVGSPVHFGLRRPGDDAPAPLLGQHTEEILRTRLGKSPEEVARLKKEGVV